MTTQGSRSLLQDSFAGQRLLLVASTGGHLAELDMLASLIDVSADSMWVSFENKQSASLFAERRHFYVPYVAPRDVRGTFRAYREISRILKRDRFDGVVSTGAAVGVSGLAAARRHRLESAYVESLARYDGPSMTGKIVSRIPGVQTYTQQRSWAGDNWLYDLSIINSWESGARDSFDPKRIFVTIGTISPYRFDRLVDRMLDIVPTGIEIRWQLGDTTRPDLDNADSVIDASQFRANVEWADVVVTHAGVGNIISTLSAGASSVTVPRRSQFDEHVDDHQTQLAQDMDARGLSLVRDADELTWDDLVSATRHCPYTI